MIEKKRSTICNIYLAARREREREREKEKERERKKRESFCVCGKSRDGGVFTCVDPDSKSLISIKMASINFSLGFKEKYYVNIDLDLKKSN